ncbi:30S ribosomal protein S12 methylthiotransferase accessory factor YcaO [Candidatus Steffania adelgidicola]|uniref:30S ribosomal protein S12 methylthiotransferase accessory factor YcaO n=1 Tax=Candidatus Steffania adelgidicola TaxID=1076626 RepID=UPI001D002BEE|nr:30S ribosomal protein S12 methylthiotransferase accessory factor YcaO [Candidatus Steffania adelgidicola]UDG79976.1 Ribosomal protein S12 methylthiotransferase accessory factor YcaO [Candidatus Steffania adelgidicola]
MTQTFISGKDASIEDSIAHFQMQLKVLGCNIEEVSWLNPVPNIWSVHIRDRDCPICFSNGKGLTRNAALASALGEYFERLSTNYFFSDFYLGATIATSEFVHYPHERWFMLTDKNTLPAGILDNRLHDFYDPNRELSGYNLVDLQSSQIERGICALPFNQQSNGKNVYIPINIINTLYASNGMAAGNTISEARVQALSEILERHVKNRIISEAISLPAIPNAVLSGYPAVAEAIKSLEASGFPLFSFDASLGGKFPVICIALFNPDNGTCFASFGAHPNFGVALARTLTELLQGRSLKDLDVFTPPTFDNQALAEQANLETHFIDSSGLISWDMFKQESQYPFSNWNFSGTTETEFCMLMRIFQQHGSEVYIADYQHLGVYSCRILAPGMSDVYPTEDLLLSNNPIAIDLRSTICKLPATRWEAKDYLALLEKIYETRLDDFIRVREFLGLATDSNSPWFTLRVGELKAMLALAGGDHEQALIWTEWTRDFNDSGFNLPWDNYYRCLHTLLQLKKDKMRTAEQYQNAFTRMYGEQTLSAAKKALSGDTPFYNLTPLDKDLYALPAHRSLLVIYEKTQQAKRCFWSKHNRA